jgi:hypothetical protein
MVILLCSIVAAIAAFAAVAFYELWRAASIAESIGE